MSVDASPPSSNPRGLLAAIDMGTNSFKLFIVHTLPNGRFLTIDRIKDPVLLGQSLISSSHSPSSSLIPLHSQIRAVASLRHFSEILRSHSIRSPAVVATSAVRSASNRADLLSRIHQELGFEVNVISGEEEARLIYLGVLQFLPVYSHRTLVIDIGGGSTEFVVGNRGQVIFASSLQLGHVCLTKSFVNEGNVANMRDHIRRIIAESGLIEKAREIRFDVAVGCSGTIRSIGRAITLGHGNEISACVGCVEEFRTRWRYTREELSVIVERLLNGEETGRVGFSKKRAEFIVAGAVLLWEIFEALGIEEMEVSEYALGEGVISEMLASNCVGFDINANVRWRSVTMLAGRFNDKKQTEWNLRCAGIAKEIFEGLKAFNHQLFFKEKDLEYLEAAILLHGVGLVFGKKGYHKHSYHIIKNRDDLHGYNDDEVELIALLARFHRKKFPAFQHHLFPRFTKEARKKIIVLCSIMRISLTLARRQCTNFQGINVSHSHEGFKLVLSELKDQSSDPVTGRLLSSNIEAELKSELEQFKEVFQQSLSIVISLDT